MDDGVRRLRESLWQLEQEAAECLAEVRDPALDTIVEDGRTLRQVIHDLSDHYRRRTEQLLWTKWGQRIPRSETTRALAELQAARAEFAAYFTDLDDAQLDVASPVAQKASPRGVIRGALEEERKRLDLIRRALGQPRP